MAYEVELHAERRKEQQNDPFWADTGPEAERYPQQVPNEAEFREDNEDKGGVMRRGENKVILIIYGWFDDDSYGI